MRAGEDLWRRTEAAHLGAVTCQLANIYSACYVNVKALAQKCPTWVTIYLGVESKGPVKLMGAGELCPFH